MSHSNKIKPFVLLAVFALLLIFAHTSSFAASSPGLSSVPAPAVTGIVDSILSDGKHVTVEGWAVSDQQGTIGTQGQIKLGEQTVYQGAVEVIPRADVASHFQRPDWLLSGWKIVFELPSGIRPGNYPVEIYISTQAGQWQNIGNTPTSTSLTIDSSRSEQRREIAHIKIWLACSAIFLTVIFFNTRPLTAGLKRRLRTAVQEPVVFSGAVLLVFFLFVGLGLTGSSLPLGLQQTPVMQADMKNIFGPDRPIRGDEWSVVTPMAIAQYNHSPRFPVINRNLGEDGQNMLIVNLSGVPVAHVSSLAKPATWGFFLFDLKRALAWYWYFPIFGCFLAFAFVLNALAPDNWRYSFLFSALLLLSPNIVAWSNWPAYIVFFPCMIFLSALQLLKTCQPLALAAWGLILGLATAGFVLVLFPSLQVSVGYVFIALTVGIILRDRLYNDLTRPRALTFVAAIAVTGIILGTWWLDARDAIRTMGNTVYPGLRVSTGAGMSMADLLRGFSNVSTLEHMDSTVTNQSEISSFYLLLLPLLTAFLFRLLQNRLTAIEWSLAAIITFILFYMFVGLPEEVSKTLLWGRVPTKRADLALGLACLMLTHLLMANRNQPEQANSLTKSIACAVALAWSYIVYQALKNLSPPVLAELDINLLIALLLVTTATGYYLIINKTKPFLMLSLGLSIVSTVHFNPINIAPSHVSTRLPESVKREISNTTASRVLVLENFVSPMFLAASGIPIAAGTFYYPQLTLWQRLDPQTRQFNTYNRYQRLLFTDSDSVASHSFENPHPDVVKININLRQFDFNQSGATLLLAPDQERTKLASNSSLSFITSASGWSWFNIKDH